MTTTGAQVLLEALKRSGVSIVFGHPGGAMLPTYDALIESGLRHILARHEQGAGHMAEGYAQATGDVGVVLATSGPGATNLVTPLADAFLDSIPVVAITGQVAAHGLGREAFQEADIVSIVAPVTKHAEAIHEPQRLAPAVAEAVFLASTGRPGPVLLDIPKDVLAAPAPFDFPQDVAIDGYPSPLEGHPLMVRKAAQALSQARKPVLYVGGGAIKSGASHELRRLAEMLNAPVVTTLMAQGAFPDTHPAHLGMPGMHGHWVATTAMQHADVLVALGARFDDRVTGDLDSFAPDALVVHVDIDPVEIGKNRAADVPIVGDCRTVIEQLVRELAPIASRGELADTSFWWSTLRRWQQEHQLSWDEAADTLKPQAAIQAIAARLEDDAIVVTGVGQHQMWAAQLVQRDRPRSFITSGGLGTMGFGLPAAIGAKAGRPAARVVLIDGDGSFQMTVQELATARTEGLPIICFVVNNSGLGMVKQWQELFFDGRLSQVDLPVDNPCLSKLAEAYGWVGLECANRAALDAVLDKAFSVTDQPVLVDLRVDPEEHVLPMVPSGGSNSAIVEYTEEGARS